MDSLIGKTILIGKEAGKHRLLIAVNTGGKILTCPIGIVGSVPASVSRCIADKGVAHCQLEIGATGNMSLTNLKPENVTYVDDVEIMTKHITPESTVMLGHEKYRLVLGTVLEAAKKLVKSSAKAAVQSQPPAKPTVSITHLEKVYAEYEEELNRIKKQQTKFNKQQRLPIILGLAASTVSGLASQLSGLPQMYVTLPVSLISLTLWIYFTLRKDNSEELRKAATDRLIDYYVCPNPECRHFLGYTPYKILRQNKKCSYCQCNFDARSAKY